MNAGPLNVSRTSIVLKPDPSRVLLRPFVPGDSQRIAAIVSRVLEIREDQVGPLLDHITREFSWRHLHVHSLFLKRFGRSVAMSQQGFSATAVGLTTAIGGAIGLPVALVLGGLSDRIGRKRLPILCYGTGLFALPAIGFSSTAWGFWG